MAKTVLITGSSSGIGRATALKFAKGGCNVVINGRNNAEALSNLKSEIDRIGVKCVSVLKDVGQFSEVSDLFEILKSENCIPDIIINNAGISYIGLLQDMSIDEWQNTINTNLTSVFNCCKCAIPYMVHNKAGRIINISSMWGNVGASCEVAYSASKGGINAFTKALAKELAPSGISVNAVAFGTIDTRMNSFLNKEELQELIEDIPVGRICSVEEAADIIYTISNLPLYVTGQIITADGAYT